MLRWQNDQGTRMRQEYTVLEVSQDGQVKVNPESYSTWLLDNTTDSESDGNKDPEIKLKRSAAEAALDKKLSDLSNTYLHPENWEYVNAAWTYNPKTKMISILVCI